MARDERQHKWLLMPMVVGFIVMAIGFVDIGAILVGGSMLALMAFDLKGDRS